MRIANKQKGCAGVQGVNFDLALALAPARTVSITYFLGHYKV